ncbi:MAG: type II toxin-antitoxin system VapC family toxin [Nitrospiraceae bacterium]
MPASWAYFDTSVLVKRYVSEQGSIQARSLLRRHRLLSSAIAPVEALSALSRRQAAGELAERNFKAILTRMRLDRPFWELVEVSPLVLNQTEELILKTALRTLDAIHVASALAFQAASGIRTPFITGDHRQADAAEELGLDVVFVK